MKNSSHTKTPVKYLCLEAWLWINVYWNSRKHYAIWNWTATQLRITQAYVSERQESAAQQASYRLLRRLFCLRLYLS